MLCRFSALQRAEIAEIVSPVRPLCTVRRFSALQRAEIAEMVIDRRRQRVGKVVVSVLFNEPKLLKRHLRPREICENRVSVLFNEPKLLKSEGISVEI